jgi:hypothetical protein
VTRLWASLTVHTTTDIDKQGNHQTLATTHLDSHFRLTTILLFSKIWSSLTIQKK